MIPADLTGPPAQLSSWALARLVAATPGKALDTPDLEPPVLLHRDDDTAAAARRTLFT